MKRVTTIYKLTGGACWYYLLRVCATTKEKVEEERKTICFNHLSCVRGDIGSDMSVPHLFYICPAIVITVTLAHHPLAIRFPRVYSAAVYGHAWVTCDISHQRRWGTASRPKTSHLYTTRTVLSAPFIAAEKSILYHHVLFKTNQLNRTTTPTYIGMVDIYYSTASSFIDIQPPKANNLNPNWFPIPSLL
jgi:hypothetical protein